MTQILPRSRVLAAVKCALSLDPDLDSAIQSAAQALGLDVETVAECWEQEEEHA